MIPTTDHTLWVTAEEIRADLPGSCDIPMGSVPENTDHTPNTIPMTPQPYDFTANTVGYDRIDGVATVYLADEAEGAYLLMQRSSSPEGAAPGDLYLEYGDQGTGSYGSLKQVTLARTQLSARIADGMEINVALKVSDGAWNHLKSGLDRVLAGLEAFILRD